MQIPSTIQQVNKTKSQIAARTNATKKGTNNNANNSAAVAQSPRAKTDTVTLSKKSVSLAAKNVEHRLGVSPVTKETGNQSSDNGHGNGEGGSGNSNAASFSSLANNFSAALNSYKDAQAAGNESKEAVGTLA